MPPKDVANWTTNPEDITNLLAFFHAQRSRVGEGGNWDRTVLNEAAAHMASLEPPAKGGPKTATAIATKWGQIRKIFEAILQMKQKVYPGASGWTYTDQGGFNVTDETRDAWDNFSKAHPIFKPFATSGWVHFRTVDDIMPSRARDNDESQPAGNNMPASQPGVTLAASQRTSTPSVPGTPASTLKRPLSRKVDLPWSNKRSRVTGPELILALSRSVAGVGNVIKNVFAQQKSSAMSPTKKVQAAQKLALEDMNGEYIMSDERTRLSILFGRDNSAADAYIADEDPVLWADVARELLNPTQNFGF
ncbi:hypothetical protein B0H19DRAFT_1079142 [Mycena capillaripes]|nr:hypothetical protein B0H19DRAFT_1079142 [Mycena capillaripes]